MNTLQDALVSAGAARWQITTVYHPGCQVIDFLNCELVPSQGPLAPHFFKLRVTGANPKIRIRGAFSTRWVRVK